MSEISETEIKSMTKEQNYMRGYRDGKSDVLDKIRSEIEQLTSRYSISKERGGMGQVEWSDRLLKESDLLQIIDKYKAESEDIRKGK